MREFGSDFHTITSGFESPLGSAMPFLRHEVYFVAMGRQCIAALMAQYQWKRLWIPRYFCYDVIASLEATIDGEILFYEDYPSSLVGQSVRALPYQEGDALLLVNYFGLRGYQDVSQIPVPVIVDFTHDLMGEWATSCNADWCIASLRKTLPIPEGGVLWSPKGHRLEIDLPSTLLNKSAVSNRWRAMDKKALYVQKGEGDKGEFLRLFSETEHLLAQSSLSLLDNRSMDFLRAFDVPKWYKSKRDNWLLLRDRVEVDILLPENISCIPFSFVMLSDSREQRDLWRAKMIEHSIYPAILWNIPSEKSSPIEDISSRMLSIHCDGRYTRSDIERLANALNSIVQNHTYSRT